ncbi:hypothetical protein F4859DRAFT_49177 [Xylaria cf. heliscus]|nr:hypothetical protein F4859DRAFT_49177 [Xylaria cf. heliscus]
MSAHECPATITITSQEDINNASLAPCTGTQGFNSVLISTSAEGLSLTNFTGGFNISVTSSPQLQVLVFPDLVALENLTIDSAPSLTQISLPKLKAGAQTLIYPVTYTFTPSISIANALSFGGLSLPALTDLADLVVSHVPRRQLTSGGLARIASARSIDSDNFLAYPGLTSVGELRLTGYEDAVFFLPNLTSVGGDFAFTNAAGSRLQTATSLTVDGSFVLDTAAYKRVDNETTVQFAAPGAIGSANVIDVGNLTSVAMNATISSNADAHIDISSLATVGGTVSITNNTNCTFDVTKLAQVGTLSIVDNVDSTIPQLFNLARAENIHLRGNIDTSTGPNILPSLLFVSGKVTIEPWNADFNCTRLLAQQQQGLINNLSCNGTSSSPSSSPSTPAIPTSPSPSPKTSLSPGSKAGIGIGVALFVIILLCVATWLFRRRRRVSPKGLSPTTTPNNSNNYTDSASGVTIHEADPAAATMAEKPTPLAHAIHDRSHELYALPAELPVTRDSRGLRRQR